MGFLFFVTTVVLAILLSQKSSQAKRTVDPMSASYRQGYWDGVRAAEQGAAHSPEMSSSPYYPLRPNQPKNLRRQMRVVVIRSWTNQIQLLHPGISLL